MAPLMRLIELTKAIPASFWGVVVGSFFSLGGVVVSNQASDRRMRQQLAHDRELKNRERELSLRKEVYLAAAEAISAGINSLSRFSSLDIPNDKVTADYHEKSAAIARVYVIAQDNTLTAITKLTDEMSNAYLRLFAKRIPLSAKKGRIAVLQEQIDVFNNEGNRMLELMKQHNLSGEVDPRKWNVIQENFKFEQGRIDAASKEQAALIEELMLENLAFASECVSEMGALRRLLMPTLSAVRIELEMPIDPSRYMSAIEESIKNQESGLSDFIQQVGRRYTSKSADSPAPLK